MKYPKLPMDIDTDVNRFRTACESGDIDTVKKLFIQINENENINILEMRNLAVKNGYLNILKFLHENGVNITNREYQYGTNPLMIAAEMGWMDIVDYLLNPKHADVEQQEINFALMKAIRYKNIDIVDILIETGKCNLNFENVLGNTPLSLAILFGSKDIFHKLIIYGSDINYINRYDENLLHHAVKNTNIEMVDIILSFNTDIEINKKDDHGNTPLMYSYIYRNIDIMEILLKNGADPKIKDDTGKSLRDYAQTNAIKDLLDKYTYD